jgi:hypothetical protein
MARDLTVYLNDRPGQVAAVGKALGDAGINIDGGFALVVGGQGIMHVLVEDGTAGREALVDQGFEVRDDEEVVVIDLDDEPGGLGRLSKRIADAGVNLTLFYLATRTRVVLGAEDVGHLRQVV